MRLLKQTLSICAFSLAMTSCYAFKPHDAEQRIAFISLEKDNVNIYSVSPNGRDLKLLAHRGQHQSHFVDMYPGHVEWSPQGDLLIFNEGWTGDEKVMVIRKGESGMYPFSSLSHPSYFRWSPDGQFVSLTHSGSGELNDIFIQSRKPQSLPLKVTLHPKVQSAYFSTWSPDGKQLGYLGNTGQQYDVFIGAVPGQKSDGSVPQTQRLTDTPEAEFELVWSPDGQWLAYVAQSLDKTHYLLKLVSPTSKEHKTLLKVNNLSSLGWHPSKPLLLFSASLPPSKKYSVFTLDIESKELKALTHSEHENFAPRFSPNGQQIVYVSRKNKQSSLRIMNLDGQRARTLKLPGHLQPYWPVWSR